MIARAIEKRLGRQGFSKIWLTNYIGYPPPSDFWLKIGYKFDIDEGYRSLKKYKLKPLPKDFKKLESEVWKMVRDEDGACSDWNKAKEFGIIMAKKYLTNDCE